MKKNYAFVPVLFFVLCSLFSFSQVPPPKITSFTPTSGPVGTTVQIIGQYFNSTLANNVVYFGATKATVTAVSANTNTLTVTVPAGATYNYITDIDPTYPGMFYSIKPFLPTFSCGGLISSSSFGAKSDFTAGSSPYCVATADFDGDGKADVAVVNENSNTVSVFRNTSTSGTISFAAKVDFTTASVPLGVAVGDFNADGKIDIAVANFTSNSVSVFKNQCTVGTISFAAKSDFTVGTHPFSVAVNDLNNDGFPDIISANSGAASVSILKNTGSMTFAAKVDFTVGTSPYCVVSADLDGDGKPDIATANNGDNTVSTLHHTGTASSLTFATNVDFPVGLNPTGLAAGDLDNDGKPELVTGNTNANPGSISVLHNTSTSGTINYATNVDYNTASGLAATEGVAIGDVDGDGLPDIASTESHPAVTKVSVFKNNGSMNFAAHVDFTTGAYPYSVAISDLDNDGKSDLVTANNSGTSISALRNIINVTPTMASANTVTICSGDTVNLSLTSNVPCNYVWVAANNANTTGESTSNQTGSIVNDVITDNSLSAQNITYTITPTSLSGCPGTKQTVTVTVKPNASMGLTSGSSTQTVCINTPITAITYSVAGGGTGAGAAGLPAGVGGNYSAGTFSIAGTPTVTGTFNYTVTTTGTCTQTSATGIITVNPDASINLTSGASTQTVCVNSPISAITYSVSGGGTGAGATGLPAGVSGVFNAGSFSIAGTPTVSGTFNYTVTTTGTCAQTSATGILTVNPLPVVSFSGLNPIYCYNASPATLTGNPLGGTFSGAGISGNTFTPSVAGSGTYTVSYTYTNANNCTNTSVQNVQVAATPVTPDICLVTVDSLSQNNLILWDKTSYVHGDTFLIYRDTANNAYGLIGKVSFDSLSLFADTVRTLYAADGNPNVTSWRYKIAVQDTCGNISTKSLYHQSIYIQNSSGNFSWNDYKIEGQPIPVPSLTNYVFQRDNLSNGNYVTIQTLSASSVSYTDPNYSAYQNTATWRVKTLWSINCTATVVNPKNPNLLAVNLNSSKSNAFRQNVTAVNTILNGDEIIISPNPSAGIFQVSGIGYQVSGWEVYNIYGEKVYEEAISDKRTVNSVNNPNGYSLSPIDLRFAPKGIYFLHLKTKEGTVTKKIVIR